MQASPASSLTSLKLLLQRSTSYVPPSRSNASTKETPEAARATQKYSALTSVSHHPTHASNAPNTSAAATSQLTSTLSLRLKALTQQLRKATLQLSEPSKATPASSPNPSRNTTSSSVSATSEPT